jgi:pSer/pThr/pTyr-binding forkhead associated (FHA) protein
MSARVTLTATAGALEGKEFVFEHPRACLVGRGADCELHLPDDVGHRTVSRRHCLLTIEPPVVHVCDCGSRNGTYVNGENIGQRRPDQRPEQVGPWLMEEHFLNDGDELRLGDAVFQVSLSFPAGCARCGKDIAASGTLPGEAVGDDHLCDWCRHEMEPAEDRPAVFSI